MEADSSEKLVHVIISRDTREHGLTEEKLKPEYSESVHTSN